MVIDNFDESAQNRHGFKRKTQIPVFQELVLHFRDPIGEC